MPNYKKRYGLKKKTYKRKRQYGYKKRAMKKYSKPQVQKMRSGNNKFLPDAIQTKLTYADQLTLTSTAGAVAIQQYAFNNIQDPDYTNGGTNHQPMGYDQLSALYEEYIVYGCSYKIKVIGYSDTGVLTVTKTDDATQVGTSDWVNMIEQPYTQQRYLQIGAVKPTIIKGYMGVKKLRGQSKYDDYQTTLTGASPSNQVFLNLNYQTFDKASTSSIDCVVTLKFYCKFKGRVQLASS